MSNPTTRFLSMGAPFAAIGLMIAGFAPPGSAGPDNRLLNAASEPNNWLTQGGTYSEQRYSTLDLINDQNVGKLSLAWYVDLDTNRGQEATPIVVDGVLYASTAWSKVWAVDAATGRELWRFDPEVPGEWGQKGCCDVVNRGVAYYDGKIYLSTFDGRLIALDAKTGKPIWSTQTTDRTQPYTITMAPRIIRGKVMIGNSGSEFGVRGFVAAFDAQTGKESWRFYVTPGDPKLPFENKALEAAAKTWSGEWWKMGGGGGSPWDSLSYDPETNLVIFGTGNGAPWNDKARSEGKGDNLYLSSIVAVDADTGEYRWHYQTTPGEAWDFDATQTLTLSDLVIDGKPRKVVMQANKNGFFYVIDRTDGSLISANNFVPVNWASGVDPKTGRPNQLDSARYKDGPSTVYPSALGAHNWQPASFSPKTGLVYIPAQEVPYVYQTDKTFKFQPGTWNLGLFSPMNFVPEDAGKVAAIRASLKGELIAWDPVARKEAWRYAYDGPWNGGALTTAGNLVFEGSAKGEMQAFDAGSGKRLWSYDVQTGAMAAPVTYQVGGEQYVAAVIGFGGGYGLSTPFFDDKRVKPNGRILAFKLGGTATLPPYAPPPPRPANPPAEKFSAQRIAYGQRVYEGTCGYCHGAGAISSGVLPDLRRSPFLATRKGWDAVVIGGALKDSGMVSFSRWLPNDSLEAVRAYVGHRASELREEERVKP